MISIQEIIDYKQFCDDEIVELIASTHSCDVFSALVGTVNLNVLESTITLNVVALT